MSQNGGETRSKQEGTCVQNNAPEAEPGRDMPTASLNAAIVLAVNIPPQEPGHGVQCKIHHFQ